MSFFKDKMLRKKAGKNIYDKEYNLAKAEALREARSRGRNQIKERARAAAYKKYNVTASEKRQQRKAKFKDIQQRMAKMSNNLESGFDLDKPSGKGKKSKSMWDMELKDFM